jgi:hypothetical protein
VKDVDVGGLFEAGGVIAPIRDSRELIEQLRVTSATQSVEWPGEVDLDPDVSRARLRRPDRRPDRAGAQLGRARVARSLAGGPVLAFVRL